MSAPLVRPRAFSAPPCAHHVEEATGQRVYTTLYEIHEKIETGNQKIVDHEWGVNRHENDENGFFELKNVFIALPTKAGDLMLRAPCEVLEILIRHHDDQHLNLGQANAFECQTPNPSPPENVAETHDAPALNCSGNPMTCAMCALKAYYPSLVQHVICLQHVQTKRGCKHTNCEYCHPTPEEIGEDATECKVFKLTGYCRFRQPQPGQKACRKTHNHEVPKYLPSITHKQICAELYNEVMTCVSNFAQRLNENF